LMVFVRLPRRAGARAEFERFVDGCAGELLRTGYLITWDIGEAEDLVQETLLRVARRWPRVRLMDQRVAYARRILVYLAIDDSKRRGRRRRELEQPDGAQLEAIADETASGLLGAVDARAEVLDALASLAPRQRVVLVLRYFEDLSEAQAADILGCSLGTVKSTTSRALARLRDTLEPVAAAANGHLVSDTKERQ
jgi:RNA polymerase sigma-70 factor (sigma-E family)